MELRSGIRDKDELNQRGKVVFIPVSISNSLCDLDPVVEAFQLASVRASSNQPEGISPDANSVHHVAFIVAPVLA